MPKTHLLNNSITTILFDLDGTLLFYTPSSLDVFLQILAEKGFEDALAPQTWTRIRRWVHNYWGRSPELAEDVRDFGKSGELTDVFWVNYMRKKLIVTGVPEAAAEELLSWLLPGPGNFSMKGSLFPGVLIQKHWNISAQKMWPCGPGRENPKQSEFMKRAADIWAGGFPY